MSPGFAPKSTPEDQCSPKDGRRDWARYSNKLWRRKLLSTTRPTRLDLDPLLDEGIGQNWGSPVCGQCHFLPRNERVQWLAAPFPSDLGPPPPPSVSPASLAASPSGNEGSEPSS